MLFAAALIALQDNKETLLSHKPRSGFMDCTRKESSRASLEVSECKVETHPKSRDDSGKLSGASRHQRFGEDNVEKKYTSTLRQSCLSFKRKASEGCVVSLSSEPPYKRPTFASSTAEILPVNADSDLPYADGALPAKIYCVHSSVVNDLSSQGVNLPVFSESESKDSAWSARNGESFSLHGSSHLASLDTRAKSTKAWIEKPLQISPSREALTTSYAFEASTLSHSTPPDLKVPFCSFQNLTPNADGYADSNRADHLSPKSRFQEYYTVQQPLCAPEVGTFVRVSGILGFESQTQSTTRDLGTVLGSSNMNQVVAVGLPPAEYSKSIHLKSVQMDGANFVSLVSEGRSGSTGMFEGRAHSVAKPFDCLDPLQGDADEMVTMGPVLGGFSFQRLISGDITGLEHEFEEDSDEDCEEKVGGEAEKEDSDRYSTVCTPSADQGLDLNARTPDSGSQHSDDMYYSESKISKHVPLRSCSADFDSEVSELPADEGASCSKPHRFYGSPCLQPKVVGCQRTYSDSSRDLYSEDFMHNSRQQMCSGSPCLHSTTDAYRPVLPWDPFREEGLSLWRQHRAHGSPCFHPISDLARQSSTEISDDLTLCPTSDDLSFCPISQDMMLKTKRPKEERTVSSPFKRSVKEESVREETGTLIDMPTTAKALFSSGLLEGYPVSYQAKGGGVLLTGIVKNGGILCNCRSCKGKTLVNVSNFEIHAGSTARHPSENIFLENGKSLQDILKVGLQASDGKSVSANCSAMRNSISKEVAIKDPQDTTSAAYHKNRFDYNTARLGQPPLPLSQRDINKLPFLPGGLPDGTEVAYYMKGQRVLMGTKEGPGICCSCCKEVISCSLFEAHAGWGSRRNPYNSIFLSNGQSLHKFAQTLASKMHEDFAAETSRDNDDICGECGDGGDLVLCDACPGAYHTECLGLLSVPEGDWFCPRCEAQVERSRNAKRELSEKTTQPCGLLCGTIASKKGLERCQRVVKASKNSIGGCVICKNGDFLKTGFGAKTVLLCDQCEREFHVGCMKEKGIVDLQELPAGEWFCGADCTRIHKVLEELVSRGPRPVCTSTWNDLLLVKQREKGQRDPKLQISEYTWQLLHGRRGDPENGKVLSETARVFTESFEPIVDNTSGQDLISLMVHSRSVRDQDFRGMYCVVLKWKQTIVSTAMIRVFGRHFAEMPLVATGSAFRGQGCFQLLMSNIERLLGLLQVKYLVLPATDEAEGIWTRKFGFSKLEEDEVQEFESEVQMMMFQTSSMLLKSIPQQASHE